VEARLHSPRVCIVLGLSLAIGAAAAQHPAFSTTPVPIIANDSLPAPDATLGDAIRNLATRAGVVFVGQVTSIEHKSDIVEVHFAVQQTVQGTVGTTYTLREWAGLWPQGEQRYTLGQRAMIFLHPTSTAGLSSPVDGMEGIVPLVPMGADTTPLLDVRRLATRIKRPVGLPMTSEAVSLDDAIAAVKASAGPIEPLPRWLPITAHPHTTNAQ
jgi:hypothetical protein